MKIFHINDKHDAYRHGTKCIWGQEAQTSPMEFTISNRIKLFYENDKLDV